jgi:hypothetical protein
MNSTTLRHAALSREARPASVAFKLAQCAAVTLQAQPGWCLHLDRGQLWLTEPGDPDDHFLRAGQSHTMRHGGPVVIENDGAGLAEWRWADAGPPQPSASAVKT